MVNEGTATSVRLFISLHIHFSLEKQLAHFLNVSLSLWHQGYSAEFIHSNYSAHLVRNAEMLHIFAPFVSCFISKHISGFSVVKSCCGTLSLAKVLIYS